MHATTSPTVPWVLDDGGAVVGRRGPAAFVGAAVALVPALAVLFAFEFPLLLIGIPAAAVAGAIVGPTVRERTIGAAVGQMAILTIVVAEALVLSPGFVEVIRDPAIGPDELVGGIVLAAFGLVYVGVPMLLITAPCAWAWAAIVQRLGRREMVAA